MKTRKKRETKKKVNTQTESAKTDTNISVSQSPDNPIETEPVNVEIETHDSEIANLMEGYSEPKTDEPVQAEVVNDDQPRKKRESKKEREARETRVKLPGKLLVKGTNRLLTGLTVMIDSKMNPDNPIPAEYIGLSEEDENDPDLIFAAELMMKDWGLEANPTLSFFGSLTAAILTNYLMVRAMFNSRKPKPEQNAGNEPKDR